MKLGGALLLITAPISVSVFEYIRYRNRQRYFCAFLEMIERSIVLIFTEKQSLLNIARDMCREGPKELREIWRRLQVALETTEVNFETAWSEEMEKISCFAPGDCFLLLRYATAIRSYDPVCICEELYSLKEKISVQKSKEQEEFVKNFKASAGLGLSGASLLLILLL